MTRDRDSAGKFVHANPNALLRRLIETKSRKVIGSPRPDIEVKHADMNALLRRLADSSAADNAAAVRIALHGDDLSAT